MAVVDGRGAIPIPRLMDAYAIGLGQRQVHELLRLMRANRDVPAWYWWLIMDLAADGDRGMGALLDGPNPRLAC